MSEEPLLEEPRAGELHVDQLEDLDRELLNAVQWDFPLDPRPYAALGERLGIAEDEVRGTRRPGQGARRAAPALGDLRHPRARLLLGARRGQGRPRAHRRGGRGDQRAPRRQPQLQAQPPYNLWYTLAVPPGEDLDEHLDVLHRASGSPVTRKLPTLKLYKIGVKLDMTGQTAADAKAEVLEHEKPERKAGHGRAGPVRPRGRGDPHRAGGPPARPASVRGRGRADRTDEDELLAICGRSRTAS